MHETEGGKQDDEHDQKRVREGGTVGGSKYIVLPNEMTDVSRSGHGKTADLHVECQVSFRGDLRRRRWWWSSRYCIHPTCTSSITEDLRM